MSGQTLNPAASRKRKNIHGSAAAKRKKIPNLQLSNLPKDVLCSITSKLPLKEAVRTSVLSSHWKRIWTCRANLDLSTRTVYSDYDWDRCSSDRGFKLNKRKFIKIVDSVLKQHEGVGTEQFRIRFALDNKNSYRINRWVKNATALKTKGLVLELYSLLFGPRIVPYDFPLKMINSNLCYLRLWFASLKVPADSRGSLNLTKLSLQEVNITDEDLHQFLSECNHLREVDITDCRMLTNLRIPGHLNQLKSLLVAICPLLREIKLSCSVTALDYRGPLIPLQLAIPSQTTNVSISLSTFHSALGYIFSDLPSTLTNLETLTLKSKQVERADMLSSLPRLISLRHLTLRLTISDLPQRKIDLLDFASLLKVAPFMEKLELHRYCQDDGELRSLPRCPHSHLSWVQITGFFGEKDQLELALHILRNATVLKAMVIETSLNAESEKLEAFQREGKCYRF
uniref:F-box domain-containing protein n=1 Tax=Oryza punctata TaxID=4537 RepID=A0A0E0KW22_ORYPU